MPARGLRAHKAVRGYQPPASRPSRHDEQTPRAPDRGAAPRTRRGRPTRCARPPDRCGGHEQAELTRREAGGPEVHLGVATLLVLDGRSARGSTPAGRVEGRLLRQVADLEVGGEGGERQPRRPGARPGRCRRAPRRQGRCRAIRHGSPPPAGEPEGALAERDRRVELAVEGQGPGVEPLEGHARAARRGRARSTKRCEMSTPWTSMPRRPRAWAWRPGPQPTSSTRMPGSSPSAPTRKPDLLLGPLRERVAQVGRPQVVRQVLEPVVAGIAGQARTPIRNRRAWWRHALPSAPISSAGLGSRPVLVVHETHRVAGREAEAFADLLRDGWREAGDDGVRLLWSLEQAHGTGPSYTFVSMVGVRSADDLVRHDERVRDGDLQGVVDRARRAPPRVDRQGARADRVLPAGRPRPVRGARRRATRSAAPRCPSSWRTPRGRTRGGWPPTSSGPARSTCRPSLAPRSTVSTSSSWWPRSRPMVGAGPQARGRAVAAGRPARAAPAAAEPGGAGRAPRPRHLDARRPRGARPLGEPPAPGGSLVTPRLTPPEDPLDPLGLHAAASPDKAAIIDDGRTTTYAELNTEVNRLASGLLALGIRPGERAVWCGPNSTPGARVHPRRPQGRARRGAGRLPVHRRGAPVRHRQQRRGARRGRRRARRQGRGGPRPAAQGPRGRRVRRRAPSTAPGRGTTSSRPASRRSSRRRSPDERRRHDDLHVGHHREAQGRAAHDDRPGARRARCSQELRLQPGNEVHITTGPLYHSGPLAWASLTHTLGGTIVLHAPLRRRAVDRPRARAPASPTRSRRRRS